MTGIDLFSRIEWRHFLTDHEFTQLLYKVVEVKKLFYSWNDGLYVLKV